MRVSRVSGTPPVHSREEHDSRRRNRENKREPRNREEVKDHFEALSRACERAHRKLVEKKIPYRFCVTREKDEIFIDLLLLDARGDVQYAVKKNITHEDFELMLDEIERGEGLLWDRQM